MFKFFDFAANAQQVVDIVVPLRRQFFFIVVDVEFFGVARCGEADSLARDRLR